MKIGLWFAAVSISQSKFNKRVTDFNCLLCNQDIIKTNCKEGSGPLIFTIKEKLFFDVIHITLLFIHIYIFIYTY